MTPSYRIKAQQEIISRQAERITKLEEEAKEALAQRHRAERAEAAIAVLQEEINKLKGDQVPIGYGWFHEDTGEFSRHVSRTNAHNEYPFVASLAAEGYRPKPIYDRPQKPVSHPDTKRMNWLVSQHVEVRTPMVYGSHARFVAQCDSDDCEEYHTTLREQTDAAIEAAGGIVKDGE
jgi:hypothetical protein